MLEASPDGQALAVARRHPQPVERRPEGAGAPSGGSTTAPKGPAAGPEPGALIAIGEFEHPPLSDGCCGSTIELLNERTGELVTSRCKATNRCPRCQRRYVRETVEMLLLDAAEWAPTLWVVLTAREHLARKDTHAHLRHIRRVTRKRWPDIEWFVQVEFQRRGALHLNLVIKGVDPREREQLLQVIAGEWCLRVDALPAGQWAGEIADAGGLTKYLAKTLGHGLKAEQAPPLGWKGHRTSQTRGYLVRSAALMRAEARASLKRQDTTRAAAARGHRGAALEQAVEQELAAAEDASWVAYAPHLLNHPGWVASRREALRVGENDAQDQDQDAPDQEPVDPRGSARARGRVWPLSDRPPQDGRHPADLPDLRPGGPVDLRDPRPPAQPRVSGGRTDGRPDGRRGGAPPDGRPPARTAVLPPH
jgi:hypothetical protein